MRAVVVDDDDLRLLGLQRLRSRLRVALLSRALHVRPLVVYHNDLRLLLLHLLRLLRLRTRLLHRLRHLLLHRHLPLLLRLRLIPLLLPVTLLRLPVIRLPSRLLRVVGLRRSRLLPVCGLLLKLSAVALLLSTELRLRLLLRESVLLSHAVLRLSHARLRGIRLRIVILLRAEIRL